MSGAKVDEVVANAICCLAYDPESEDIFDMELSFACEELVSRNVTYVLSDGLDGKVCAATTEEAYYVDYNVDRMYNYLNDGPLFDMSLSVAFDSFDGCCYDAIDNEDLESMKEACECDETEDDEYFIFDDTLTCTRRFDRTTQCALKSDRTSANP